uniref:Extended synaptotagmin-like protein 3 n=1 Tax=Cyclopterus lumpus TaxID=8103 RepID=A0A8C3A5J8_CYCLU
YTESVQGIAACGTSGNQPTDPPMATADGPTAIFVLYPVYLTGYLGLSVSWVLLCMAMATWWKKNRQRKDARIGTAIDFVNNETRVVNQELQSALQMATWVHFPDVEKVDWVNKVLQQAWPFFGMYMEKLLKENIQPAIRLSSPALKMFTFTKVHFGHIPLRITGMKAYTDEVDHREVVLDLNICYDGDVDIDAEVKPPITAGVKGLQLKGMIRVILEPLIGQAPLVGGVTFFFIRRPTLQINWTGMTNLLDSPAFSSLSEETIMDIIASLMVLPNRMCVPLIDQVKVDEMRFPLPRGVVRVHLLEARDLLAKDTFMMGLVKGKSDPYATLRVGNRHFKSKIVKENLHPKWNEVYEFVVHEAPGQELEMEVYDEDTDKDDLLGTYYTRHCLLFAQVAFASKDPVWEQGFTFFVHNVQTQQLLVQVCHLMVYDNPLCVPVACRNIFRFSENGTDSYVRLYFLPDQTWIHRKRTHVKKRTVDPVFNHKFEFDVSLQEAQTRKLDVAVKNGKMFHSRDRKDIGMVGNATCNRPRLFIPFKGYSKL